MTGATWLVLGVFATAAYLGALRGIQAHRRARALEVDLRELRRRWRR